MKRRTAGAASLVLGMVCGGAGCGAATGLDGDLYRGDGFAFRVRPPDLVDPSWKRIDHSHALAYRHEPHQSTIMVHARCDVPSDDVPLMALKNHLFLQFTEREVHAEEVVPFDGREALHTELTASLDGVPMRYDVWVLKKDGCVYDLLYAAPPERFGAGRGSFRALVDGFATVATEAPAGGFSGGG
ncbi:MAG: hypothetical protein AAF715_07175 [Myxococcota bacterium]